VKSSLFSGFPADSNRGSRRRRRRSKSDGHGIVNFKLVSNDGCGTGHWTCKDHFCEEAEAGLVESEEERQHAFNRSEQQHEAEDMDEFDVEEGLAEISEQEAMELVEAKEAEFEAEAEDESLLELEEAQKTPEINEVSLSADELALPDLTKLAMH
jgi:hypothetical protein